VADAVFLEKNIVDLLVTIGWCWFGGREKYYWLDVANRVSNHGTREFGIRIWKINSIKSGIRFSQVGPFLNKVPDALILEKIYLTP